MEILDDTNNSLYLEADTWKYKINTFFFTKTKGKQIQWTTAFIKTLTA